MNKIQRQLELIQNNTSKTNYEILNKWANSSLAKGLTEARIIKQLQMMRQIAIALDNNLDKTTKEDIEELIRKINTTVLPNKMEGKVNNYSILKKKQYTDSTKQTYKVILKSFYKWLEGNDEIFPEKVRWIKGKAIKISQSSKTEREQYLKENILSVSDIKKLIDNCQSDRDKAIISLLFESGARIGEFLGLKIKDVKFTSTTTDLTLRGKTGTRTIPIVASTGYLSNWLSKHPHKDKKEYSLFITNRGKELEYAWVVKIIKQIFKKSKINKPSNPHIFRHSRATERSHHWKESVMRKFFGWSKTSDMPSYYSHLSDDVLKSIVESENGIGKVTKKNLEKYRTLTCDRCKEINDPANKYCSKCSYPLTDEAIRQQTDIEDKMQELVKRVISRLPKEEAREIISSLS